MRTLGGRGLAAATAGLFLLLLPLAGAAPGAEPPLTLRILWDRPLPEAAARALDVRWASDDSVYLALGEKGVVEMSLAPFGEEIAEILPGETRPGGFFFASRLAVSGDEILIGSSVRKLTWRTRSNPLRREAAFVDIVDLDLHRGRALVLGSRLDAGGQFAPEGGIAWMGTLASDLADAKPVVFDSRGAGVPNLGACGTFEMGAVRFLADGSYVVVPGVQPGAFHFDAGGKLLRTWDTLSLGLTDDCARLTHEQARRIHFPPSRWEWLNARRTLDEVVPLPTGIGLVVRSVESGQQRWELAVLGFDSGVAGRLPLSIPPINEITHLQADLRGDRLVLLVRAFDPDPAKRAIRAGRLVMAQVGLERSAEAITSASANTVRRTP